MGTVPHSGKGRQSKQPKQLSKKKPRIPTARAETPDPLILIPNKAQTWWSTLGEGCSSRQNNATDRIGLGAVAKRTKHQKYPGIHFDGILSCRPEVLSLRRISSPLGRERLSGKESDDDDIP